MKRFTLAILISLILMLIFSTVVMAASWGYKYPTQLTDTSTTTRTYYPAQLGYGAQQLVSAGYLSANGTDSNAQIATSSVKYMLSTTNVLTNLPANGKSTVDIYTGYSPAQSAFAVVCGEGGYVLTPDDAELELGDNFTVTQKGYINTDAGADKYLVHKPNAYRTYVSSTVSGNITSAILTSANVSPTGHVDPATIWATEADAYDDSVGTSSMSDSINATTWSDYLILTWAATDCNAINFYCDAEFAGSTIDVDAYYGDTWNDVYEGVYNDLTWYPKSMSTVSCNGTRVRFYNNDVNPRWFKINEVKYTEVSESVAVSATGIASGEHIITTGIVRR